MPLTVIQKRWLKAISLDPRIRLFVDEPMELPDVEPLFLAEDVVLFDRYADGDDYENDTYIRNFRLILDAIRSRYPLYIETVNRQGCAKQMAVMPEYLEYSEKDDKFRLIGSGHRHGVIVNLGRITGCRRCAISYDGSYFGRKMRRRPERVVFELADRRNALERVLMHFAHFEKQAEKIGADRYRVMINYEKEDETELVIRILSFGPMVKVTAPQSFVNLIRERLVDQKSCGL